MKTTPTKSVHKDSARLTEQQFKAVQKAARAKKMNVAEYIRACVL